MAIAKVVNANFNITSMHKIAGLSKVCKSKTLIEISFTIGVLFGKTFM